MSDAPAVELVSVWKVYERGRVVALRDIDLTVRAGERVAVIGPSGCGKTTMLHLIAALDRPSSGTVLVGGSDIGDVHRQARYRRHHVGLVFQMHNLLPQLSALQNVEVAMLGTGMGAEERSRRARDLLSDVDMQGRESRLPTMLSGGERQRVAIARSLANDPELLLADEPTGSLDEASVSRVLDLFAAVSAGRPMMSMIIVTHDPHVASTADRVVRMAEGAIAR